MLKSINTLMISLLIILSLHWRTLPQQRQTDQQRPNVVHRGPDLIVKEVARPSVTCPQTGDCELKVDFIAENIGDTGSGPFIVTADFESNKVNIHVDNLAARSTRNFTATVRQRPGRSCFDPDCTVCITIDSRKQVKEYNESNNKLCQSNPG